MPKTNRIKAIHKDGVKYSPWLFGIDHEKNHEVAAYNLMVKLHMSVKYKLELVSGNTDQAIWKMVKR